MSLIKRRFKKEVIIDALDIANQIRSFWSADDIVEFVLLILRDEPDLKLEVIKELNHSITKDQ